MWLWKEILTVVGSELIKNQYIFFHERDNNLQRLKNIELSLI